MPHNGEAFVASAPVSTEDLIANQGMKGSSAAASSTISGSTECDGDGDGGGDSDMKISDEVDQVPATSNLLVATDSEKSIIAPATEISDPNVVDWDGPDDPERPINWSFQRKSGIIVVLSVLRLLIPFASSMMAPAVLQTVADLGADSLTLGTFSITIFMLGVGIGPLCLAPLSELYGRNLIYQISNVFFTLFSVACALAPNLTLLTIFRLLAGAAGSALLTNGGGTIVDIVPKERRGLITTVMMLGQLFGPVIGPTTGGFLSQDRGWRWIFWVLSIVSGAITLLGFIFLRETHTETLLARKAARLRKETGNPELYHKGKPDTPPKKLFISACLRPLRLLTMSPVVLLLSVYIALALGYAYLLFATFSVVFQKQYSFSESRSGLSYLGVGVGLTVAVIWISRYSDRINTKKEKSGTVKAEFRLIPLLYATFTIPVGLFIYGWTVEYKIHWIVPIAATALVGIGLVIALVTIQTYLIDAFPQYAASANAANFPIRCMVAAFLPLSGLSMYEHLGYGWGNSLLAIVALIFSVIPWVCYRFGEKLRVKYTINLE